jgi:predicted nucleic acid-binding protein
VKPLKVYLDTSVINFLYAEDAPQFREYTIDFFENYALNGIYDCLISSVVITEINRTSSQQRRSLLLETVSKYQFRVLTTSPEIERLAQQYVKEGIIPRRKIDDARHVAIATVYQLDALLSWNFKHLANLNRKLRVNALNQNEGYLHQLEILTPIQLLYERD